MARDARRSGREFFAFVLTFAILGINWISHHRKFRVIERFDSGLIWINFAFLLFVALTPLPTSILSEYAPATSRRSSSMLRSSPRSACSS